MNMFKKVCLITVLGCLSAANAQNSFCSGGLCFIRPDPNSGASWLGAQQICKNNNSTLPIVDNPNRQKSFVAALSHYQMNGKDVWLGANASDSGPSNWHWLDENQYIGQDVQGRGEYNKSYAFVANRTNEVLAYASAPIVSYSYICQCNAIDPGGCTDGTGRTAFVKDQRCYMKYEEKLPWFSARNKCLTNSCDLASFSQLSLLNGMVDSSGFWVGLRTSQWNWSNAVTGLSSDVTFTSWRIAQPNDAAPTCIATDIGDFPNWRDIDCASGYSYICQVSGVGLSSVSSTTASTTTRSLPVGTPGSAKTNPNDHASQPLSSTPKMKLSEVASTGKNTNSTDLGSVNAALSIGLGVGLGVPLIILIIVVIVVAVVVLRRKHRHSRTPRGNGAKSGSGEPKTTNLEKNFTSSPTSVLQTVDNDQYQHLQNHKEHQQYEQLPQTQQYEQLQIRNEILEQQQYEYLPQSQ